VTAHVYADMVRPFLAGREEAGGLAVADLTAAEVTAFVLAACPRQRIDHRGPLLWIGHRGHPFGRAAAKPRSGLPPAAMGSPGWAEAGRLARCGQITRSPNGHNVQPTHAVTADAGEQRRPADHQA
jgi:hypothetical protein